MNEPYQFGELTRRVIGCAHNVYNSLGSGFLESVYEKALLIELEAAGIVAQAQVPLEVMYRGRVVGKFFADLVIENVVIVELKATDAIDKAHEIQLVNYLSATSREVGLVINFSPDGIQVRRKVRDLNSLKPRE